MSLRIPRIYSWGVCQYLGKYEKALNELEEARKLCQLYESFDQLAQVNHISGRIYSSWALASTGILQKSYQEKALYHYDETEKNKKDAQSEDGNPFNQFRKAQVLISKGSNDDVAARILEETRQLFMRTPSIAHVQYQDALILLDEADEKKARKLADSGIEISIDINHLRGIANGLSILSTAAFNEGRFKLALEIAICALIISPEYGPIAEIRLKEIIKQSKSTLLLRSPTVREKIYYSIKDQALERRGVYEKLATLPISNNKVNKKINMVFMEYFGV